MKPRYIFEDNKMTYSDFLKTIESAMQEQTMLCDKDCIVRGVEALSNISDEGQERLIKTSFMIDKSFREAAAVNKNCSRKLPIILKSADLLANFPDKVKDLTNEELILISYFYSVYQIPFTDKRFEFFFDKEVLNSVQCKTNDYNKQSDIFEVIDTKLCDMNINDMDELGYLKAKEEMINTVKNNTVENIINMVNIGERALEEMRQANI